MGLPPNTRNIILKWGLTDLNLRRDYASLHVYQAGSQGKIDLTNFFFVGPCNLPTFGQMTELIMPWDTTLESKLIVEFQCAQQQHQPPPQMYGMPPGYYSQMSGQENPYAYAVFSICGFQFKQ